MKAKPSLLEDLIAGVDRFLADVNREIFGEEAAPAPAADAETERRVAVAERLAEIRERFAQYPPAPEPQADADEFSGEAA